MYDIQYKVIKTDNQT